MEMKDGYIERATRGELYDLYWETGANEYLTFADYVKSLEARGCIVTE